MSVRLNSAGVSPTDPMLAGLGLEFRVASPSRDSVQDGAGVPGRPNFFVDQTGLPVSNDQKTALSPDSIDNQADGVISASNVLTSVGVGSWDTDIVLGDFIYLSHSNITDGLYSVSSVSGANLTLGSDYTFGAQTGVLFQIGWRLVTKTNTSPFVSSLSGQINFIQVKGKDGSGNAGSQEENFYVRNNPSDIIELDGLFYTGKTLATTTVPIAFFISWANKGGAATVAIFDTVLGEGGGSGQVTEITEAAIGSVTQIVLSSGDAKKSFTVRFRSKTGSTDFVDVLCDVTLDTTPVTANIIATAA